jgi:hypothetical protein
MGLWRYDFEVKYFPLVVVTSPPSVDEEGIREMFGRFEGLYRARKRYALVMDTTNTREVPNAKHRKVLTDLTQACADDARRWCVGTAMVVDSPLIRGVLTAVAWVVPSPTPTVHVATLPEGVGWCCRSLDAAGLELTPETKQYWEQLASAPPASRDR